MVGVRLINEKTQKNKQRVLFSSHQCVTVSQDKAHLLERCSLLKVLSVRVWMCVSFYVSECVLDNSAIAEPLTVRPLVEFIFIFVNETLSVCKIKGSLQRHTVVVFQRSERFSEVLEGNIRRNRLDFFSFPIHSIK